MGRVIVKQEPKEEPLDQSITFDAVVPRQSSRLAEKKSRASAEVEDGVIQVKDEGADVKLPTQEHLAGDIRDNKARKTPKKTKKEEKEEFESQMTTLCRSRWEEAGVALAGFDLDDTLRDVRDAEKGCVARTFLARTYGGSFVDSIPIISMTKYREHGFWGKYMYLGLDLQPLAPQTPGAPGIWFSVGYEGGYWNHGIVRVFTRIKENPKCLWQYQGQYEVRPAQSISADEWRGQTTLVRNTWVTKLQTKPWGAWIRARIYGRKYWNLEADPTEEDVDTIIEKGFDTKVTEDEIHSAMNRGDDRLIVYTMKCIGYDHDFQRHLLAKAASTTALKDEDEDKKKVKAEAKNTKKRESDSESVAPKPKKRRVKEEDQMV